MNKSVVVTLVVLTAVGTYFAFDRGPPVPVDRAQPPPQPESGPLPAAPDGADEAELPMSVPDIADRVAPPPPAPIGARATIVSPAPGATTTSPFLIRMAVTGLALAPAGSEDPRAGHFHVLVDMPPTDSGGPIVRDAHHIDVASGTSEVELELSPGEHTLQLLLGDGNHMPHHPPVLSDPLTVTVRRRDKE